MNWAKRNKAHPHDGNPLKEASACGECGAVGVGGVCKERIWQVFTDARHQWECWECWMSFTVTHVCVCAREISGKCGGISECPWRVYSGALYKHQQYSSWAKCTNRFSVQSQRASSYRACRASSLLCLGFKAELIQVFIKILTLYLSVCEPLMRKYLRESRSALDAEFGVWNWEQMFIV